MRVTTLITTSFLASACAVDPAAGIDAPITPGPAARQTSSSATPGAADATVKLAPTRGHTTTGELRLTSEGQGVRVVGTVTGLTPNTKHGIHIHEKGDCSAPDASSAAGHFDPLHQEHGMPGPNSHVGDLGNIIANQAGVAYVDVRASQAALHTSSVTDIAGRAVIVHAGVDDLKSQPSGDSGARVACGVISAADR